MMRDKDKKYKLIIQEIGEDQDGKEVVFEKVYPFKGLRKINVYGYWFDPELVIEIKGSGFGEFGRVKK